VVNHVRHYNMAKNVALLRVDEKFRLGIYMPTTAGAHNQ